MRARWPELGQRVTHSLLESRRPLDVLIEYEGPQLLTRVDDEGRKFLAVAADEADGFVRWLEVALSPLEEEALLDGASTIRDVFLKEEIWVVDRDAADAVVDGWSVPGELLGNDVLPRHGARLVLEERRDQTVITTPQLRIDGPKLKERSAIAFGDLSNVGWAFQRLWTSIAQAKAGVKATRGKFREELARQSTVFIAASFPGSFGLELATGDADVFDGVAREFRALVDSSDNTEQLKAIVARLTPRVAATYRDLLEVLGDADLELYTAWSGGRSYIGASQARRIRPVLRLMTPSPKEAVQVVGFFLVSDLSRGKFDITEYNSNDRYAGKVSKRLLQRLRKGEDFIATGPSFLYEATLRAVTYTNVSVGSSPPKTDYTLLAFETVEIVGDDDDGPGPEHDPLHDPDFDGDE